MTTVVDEAVPHISSGRFLEADELLEASHAEDYDAAVRFAVINLLRQILSGDRKFADSVLERVVVAEGLCSRGSSKAQARFTELSSKRRGLLKMISFQSTFAHPWVEATHGDNYIEFDAEAKEALQEWRRVEGMKALMHLFRAILMFVKHSPIKGALTLRTAWLTCKHAPREHVEGDASMFAQLVQGIFLLMLSNMPPFLQTVFSVIGFQSNREAGLALLKQCMDSEEFEVRTFSSIITSLHHLLLSQQEYKDDAKSHMTQAQEIIDGELARDPTSVLAKLVKSHIVRRQGRLEEAMELLDDITPPIIEEIDALAQKGPQVHAYRMEYDRAILHFVAFRFDEAIELLEKLVQPDSTFGAKVLATGVVSACFAMKEPADEARAAELIEGMGVDTELGRMDRSIMLKKPTLVKRTHKQLIGFEILYVFGHLKCYSPAVGTDVERNVAWLKERRDQLGAIAVATGITAERLEALSTQPVQADEIMPLEEYLACSLMMGNISALLGDLDDAATRLEALVHLWKTKSHLHEAFDAEHMDFYVPPWAMYELAAVKMRQKDFAGAKPLLEQAKKLAKREKQPFSFQHMLDFKCAGALREVSAAK